MEITANVAQTVATNSNVLFTETPVCGNCSISHRQGSGLVSLRGLTNQCRARYKIVFGGNIAIPATGTVDPISIALALDGEPISTTSAIITPAAVSDYNNVFTTIFLDIPRGCCQTLSVQNTSTQPILVQNANLIVERVA